ncbi:TIGR04255 family protein [Pseudomonas monsensis]
MTTRTGVLKNSPLTLVFASVRFAPWPLLGKRIDEIQNDLRDVLPFMHHLEVEAPDGAPQGTMFNGEAWMLISLDKSYGVQITKNQVLIFTPNYIDYADFEKKIDRVIKTLLSHMTFMHVQNMGVRYIDHIKPKAKEKSTDYISPQFIAPSIEGYATTGGQLFSEYLCGPHKIRVSVLDTPGTIPLPQDAIPVLAVFNGIENPLKLEQLKDQEFLIDMDAVSIFESAEKLSDVDITKELRKLHNVANNFFRHEEVFSDHAFKVWKGES